MILAYLIACLPLPVGAYLWVKDRQVVYWEWLLGAAVGFVVAGVFHFVAIRGMTKDIETWSGRLVKTTHYPYWHASWTEEEEYTDADGNTHTRTVHREEDHPEHWSCTSSYGRGHQEEYSISEQDFNNYCKLFGVKGPKAVPGYRPDFDYGDRNDYVGENHTNYTVPTHTTKNFENRVKAAPSVFSYADVPKNVRVYEWPEGRDWRRSSRLLGTAASDFSTYEWDCLNAHLGPSKKVNLIAVGFDTEDSSIAHWQEAKWIGGKKNDLVICYGPKQGDGTPSWVYCFGWTESELVKKNLESLFLENAPNNDLLPKIREEVSANYSIKDWSKFDYLSVEPPGWAYVVLVLVMAATQGGFWFWAHTNEADEDNVYGQNGYRRFRFRRFR